ncbi:MAG: imidazolonepropionase [Gammaproteobacteria bacterium]|nr:imidazolonepropionase [Gammaproteobacteria bacterium]
MDTSGWTRVIRNASVASGAGSAAYGLIAPGAVAIAGEHIAWAGPDAELPARPPAGARVEDAKGALLTPGLIDCHTHLVWAGSRHREFEQRLAGASYADIAKAGGGIASTVKATRAANEDKLLALAVKRASRLVAEGVTTIEIKSGYGLDLANELKLLRAARAVGERLGITVRTTLLAAHAVPPEYQGRADDYIRCVCDEILPAAAAAGLADAVDAFCETIAFTPAQVERVFTRARELGLAVKLHAEQLSNQHGAALAARHNALSADHLEHVDEAGVRAMAASGTVAVLLPAAFYFLRETQLPPIELLHRHRVPIAIASDLNPGSAPIASLLLNLNMACTLFRMTPEETLAGVTRHAAAALGLAAERGSIEAGKIADLVLWDAEHPAELVAQYGMARPTRILRSGKDLS